MTISADRQWAISGAADATIDIWSLATGQILRTLTGHRGRIVAVRSTRDGEYIISIATDNTLRVWDWQSGREIAAFSFDSRAIGLEIAPDRRTLIVCDESDRVHWLQLTGLGIDRA